MVYPALTEEAAAAISQAPWTMHEFFAGSGLVSCGLRGMFHSIWANDISEKKANVYRANFPYNHFVLGDIRGVNGQTLPFAHLSWASFPCQDISLAGSMGGIDAERSGLVWEWLRVLQEMSVPPSVLLVENVPGLISARKGVDYAKLHNALLRLGYKTGVVLLDAKLFLPQSRPRVFAIAIKENILIPEDLTDTAPNWLHNQAVADLGRVLPGWVWWKAEKPGMTSVRLCDIIDSTLRFDKDDVLRLIPPHHQRRLDTLPSAVVTGYRRTRRGTQCLELRFDGIAGCLRTPQGGSSKQFVIIKERGETHARVLSPRETARLMGAPDNFALLGTVNDGYKAMGDAVAIPVAEFLGKTFLVKLAEAAYAKQ